MIAIFFDKDVIKDKKLLLENFYIGQELSLPIIGKINVQITGEEDHYIDMPIDVDRYIVTNIINGILFFRKIN